MKFKEILNSAKDIVDGLGKIKPEFKTSVNHEYDLTPFYVLGGIVALLFVFRKSLRF